MKLLKELCEAPGIPGREQAIIDIMASELKKTTDKVKVDNMGNVVGIKKSKKKHAKNVNSLSKLQELYIRKNSYGNC